jgi:SecD/SecF fusion protein
MMILLALFFLGGDTLADFALALLIGILIGTYSSVFTAAPIAIALEDRFPGPPPEPVTKDTRRPHDKQKPKAGDRRIFE